ncbi:MAG: hypothetical protein P8Z68_11070 [Kineosporiaceae bacterium]
MSNVWSAPVQQCRACGSALQPGAGQCPRCGALVDAASWQGAGSPQNPYPQSSGYAQQAPYAQNPGYAQQNPYAHPEYPQHPGYAQQSPYPQNPGYPQQNPYPQNPGYAQYPGMGPGSAAPGRPGGSTGLIVVLVVIAVFVLGAGGATAWFLTGDGGTTGASGTGDPRHAVADAFDGAMESLASRDAGQVCDSTYGFGEDTLYADRQKCLATYEKAVDAMTSADLDKFRAATIDPDAMQVMGDGTIVFWSTSISWTKGKPGKMDSNGTAVALVWREYPGRGWREVGQKMAGSDGVRIGHIPDDLPDQPV